jgi:hypothetical protein
MSDKLIAQARLAREQIVPVGGFSFTVRRPTELEMLDLAGLSGTEVARASLRHVIGWSGVREADVIPAGNPEPLEFDPDIAAECLTDRLDLLSPLVKAVHDSFSAHVAAREAAAKN